jgi:hypothetical protein
MGELNRTEWFFRGVPDAELERCAAWEYSRQIAQDRVRILDPAHVKLVSFPDSDYFPGTAWLELPEKEQGRILGRPASSSGYEVKALIETNGTEKLPRVWSGDQIVSIFVNWKLSDDELAKRFKTVLNEQRKRIGAGQSKSARGDPHNNARIKEKLKALGALRIWNSCGRSYNSVLKSKYPIIYKGRQWEKMCDRCRADLDRFRERIEKRIKFLKEAA